VTLTLNLAEIVVVIVNVVLALLLTFAHHPITVTNHTKVELVVQLEIARAHPETLVKPQLVIVMLTPELVVANTLQFNAKPLTLVTLMLAIQAKQ